MFGWPDSFTIVGVEDDTGNLHCSETWTYYDGETTYFFLDGQYKAWEPAEVIPMDSWPTPYQPNEFLPGLTPDEVALAIGKGDSWGKVGDSERFLEGIMDEAEIYVAPQLVAGFYEDQLVFLEALALIPVGEAE
jgi:hypothetical protein